MLLILYLKTLSAVDC